MTITPKIFNCSELTYSTFTYGGWTHFRHMLDADTSLGQNVTAVTGTEGTVPVSTAGLVMDKKFVYRTPFSSKTNIVGRVEGTIIIKLEAQNATNEYVALTAIGVNLFKYRSDGSTEDIVPYTTIWSGYETQNGAGTSVQVSRNVGVLYAFDVKNSMPTDALLALRVKVFGFKSVSSANLKIKLLCSHSDGDLKISIPLLDGDT